MFSLKRQRQAAILKWIESSSIRSQKDIVEALREEGYEVSQTTVSRDLDELGVSKSRNGDGGLIYSVGGSAGGGTQGADSILRRMAGQLMLSAEAVSNMVIVRTLVGNAQGLAAAVDAVGIEGIAGTVAGDDTIIIVCSEGVDSREIRSILLSYIKS